MKGSISWVKLRFNLLMMSIRRKNQSIARSTLSWKNLKKCFRLVIKYPLGSDCFLKKALGLENSRFMTLLSSDCWLNGQKSWGVKSTTQKRRFTKGCSSSKMIGEGWSTLKLPWRGISIPQLLKKCKIWKGILLFLRSRTFTFRLFLLNSKTEESIQKMIQKWEFSLPKSMNSQVSTYSNIWTNWFTLF